MTQKLPFTHFDEIRDIRQEGKIIHSLSDILLLTVCGVICGQNSWKGIVDFGVARIEFLKRYGDFENGIPKHDTIARVIGNISPKKFQQCFINWMQSCHELSDGEVVAIDGKTVRRSYDRSKKKGAIHVVSAFATENGFSLGQIKVDEKSNEITAIPELLDLLDVSGCLVTIDAMGCQKKIAKKIVDKGADYVLAVKGNQGKLEAAFDKHFTFEKLSNWTGDFYNTEDRDCHGRHELRMHVVSDVFDEFVDLGFEWTGLKKLGVVLSFRSVGKENFEEVGVRYYISSSDLTAKKLAKASRHHWFVENKLHYKLDVGFREDECRVRTDDRAENFSRIRQMCLNLLSSEKTFKAGVERKRLNAAMDERYLELILSGLA